MPVVAEYEKSKPSLLMNPRKLPFSSLRGAMDESIPRKSSLLLNNRLISSHITFIFSSHSSIDLQPRDKSVGCKPIEKPFFAYVADGKNGVEGGLWKTYANRKVLSDLFLMIWNKISTHLLSIMDEVKSMLNAVFLEEQKSSSFASASSMFNEPILKYIDSSLTADSSCRISFLAVHNLFVCTRKPFLINVSSISSSFPIVCSEGLSEK